MMGVVLEDGATSVDVTFDGDDNDDSSSGGKADDVTPFTDAWIDTDDDDDVEDAGQKISMSVSFVEHWFPFFNLFIATTFATVIWMKH